MKERVIAIVILVIILLGAATGGYFIRGGVNKSEGSVAEFQKLNADLQKQIDALKKQPEAVVTANGVSAPIYSNLGFSRYLSNSGLTFVYKTKISYKADKPESAVNIKEDRGEKDTLITISLQDAPEIIQTFVFTNITVDTTPEEFAKSSGLADKIELQSVDTKLAVKRFRKAQAVNSRPVNSYAPDRGIDGFRLIQFTDNGKNLAYITFEENKLFGIDVVDFIDSISMIK
jgi:hypothetical protein